MQNERSSRRQIIKKNQNVKGLGWESLNDKYIYIYIAGGLYLLIDLYLFVREREINEKEKVHKMYEYVRSLGRREEGNK